jgi:flagellar L-ring protein precursor FlgH
VAQSAPRAFFADQRAAASATSDRQIDIDDSAKVTNATTSSRTSGMKAGIPHLLGLEIQPRAYSAGRVRPANALETNSTTSNAGAGQVNRSEKISLTIAAVVTGVLPNGNMVIQGVQEVRTNTDIRQLTVAGIVRPEDISSANTIRHTQIAEARISYGGRGDLSRVQKVPAGQSLIEKFSPF